MKRDLDNLMTELGSAPVDLTLQQTLERAEQLQLRKRRVRRIAGAAVAVLAVVALVLLLLLLRVPASLHPLPPALPPKVFSTAPAQQQPTSTTAPSAIAPVSEHVRTSVHHAVHSQNAHSESEAHVHGVQLFRQDDFRGPLYIDTNVIRTIAGTIAQGDRVVSVEDPDGRETCINVACSGGDTRTIVCTAPEPSPVRVTTLEGALLYDVDRADASHMDGQYVAVRTRMSSNDVLVWYRVDDRLRRIMPMESPAATPTGVAHSWLRPDSTSIAECATGSSAWAAVDVVTPAGSPAPVNALWVARPDGITQIRLRMSAAGTYVLHVRRVNGTRTQILLVVR